MASVALTASLADGREIGERSVHKTSNILPLTSANGAGRVARNDVGATLTQAESANK
jgi:hypothetical protein